MTCRSLIDMGRRRRDLGEGLTEITIFLIYGNIDQGQPLVDLWRFSEFPDVCTSYVGRGGHSGMAHERGCYKRALT